MNEGLFGFPSKSFSSILAVAEFDNSGQFIIPQETKQLHFHAIGAGGGGGSGARRATTIAAYGGGGGAHGSIFFDTIPIDLMGLQVGQGLRIIIGRGGTGGASVGTNSTNGNAGNSGGNTDIWGPNGFTPILRIGPAPGGNAGSTTSGTSGSSGFSLVYRVSRSGLTGSSAITFGQPSFEEVESSGAMYLAPCGCPGGSISTGNLGLRGGRYRITRTASGVTFSGSPFPVPASGSTTTTIIEGSASDSAVDGDSGLFAFTKFGQVLYGGKYGWGYGGGGGGAGVTVAAGGGGDGYRGGGGGGGGGSRDGFASGKGGNGGNGYVLIIALG